MEFKEQTRPLYCWKMDDNGRVVKLPPITRYNVYTIYRQNDYRFYVPGTSRRGSVREPHLDKFVNNRVYSFTDDDQKAKQIMLDYYKARISKTQYDLSRCEALLKAVEEYQYTVSS